MQEIKFTKPRLHFFICINDRCDKEGNTMPSCGPTIKPEDVKALKLWIRETGWTGYVQCTKASCLGFCNSEGGVVCMYPEGKFMKGFTSLDEIKKFIQKEVEKC